MDTHYFMLEMLIKYWDPGCYNNDYEIWKVWGRFFKKNFEFFLKLFLEVKDTVGEAWSNLGRSLVMLGFV